MVFLKLENIKYFHEGSAARKFYETWDPLLTYFERLLNNRRYNWSSKITQLEVLSIMSSGDSCYLYLFISIDNDIIYHFIYLL